MNTLVVDKISKSYNKPVVRQVSLEIGHSIVGLLGPNGAGKTTTFYMIIGLCQPDSGIIKLNGHDITHLPIHERARLGLGYLPQEASIFRQLSVWENIMAVLELRPELTYQDKKIKAKRLLNEFNIEHLIHTPGIKLSGGERRRVEIARTLASDTQLILLDEPFAGIDPISVNDIKQIITDLHKRGLSVLITDHNVRETLGICHEACIISEGQVIAMGAPDTILSNPFVRDVYLGHEFEM